MGIKLEDYLSYFKNSPRVLRILDDSFRDASRNMSSAGLEEYIEGAKALRNIDRGSDIVISYLQGMPLVVKEFGEDVIADCVTASLKLSSMTPGKVIAQLFSSIPSVSRRLGDVELFREYLLLIQQIAVIAPRGVHPMLNHIDELLSKLTLSGLSRWANFGAQAYRRDYANLTSYFNLETADAKAMLQKEHRGVLFVAVQRKLDLYLRALWGRNFVLHPASAGYSEFKPYIEHGELHVPDALEVVGSIAEVDLYRAIAAHMAAHLCYSSTPMPTQNISRSQMFFVGFMEDARVEYKASNEFPGLKKLWITLLKIEDKKDEFEHPMLRVLKHIAHMLLDKTVIAEDEEVAAFVEKFHCEVAFHQDDSKFSWYAGLELFELLATRNDMPDFTVLEQIRIPYRDDNRYVWAAEEMDGDISTEEVTKNQSQVSKIDNDIEIDIEVDAQFAANDAQESPGGDTETCLQEDEREQSKESNKIQWEKSVSEPFYYHEWDYQIQLHRPDWVTVYERHQPKGDPKLIDEILLEYRPIAHRIKQVIDLLAPKGVQRIRNIEDGEEIDINAAIESMVSVRLGEQQNPRITMRNELKTRNLSVVVLIDLSESTNESMGNSDKTILQLTREAVTLMSTAINGIGDPFALHGFASDGRHDVQYYRFKDFNQHFDEEVKSRLSGMRGGFSTRMGAALRHAGHHLSNQPERRKLILLVTDGEPADIDERDPQHLRHDTKKAVGELYSSGILTYCLTLDSHADDYVKGIFGQNNYTIIDNVNRLPGKLPILFASLTA